MVFSFMLRTFFEATLDFFVLQKFLSVVGERFFAYTLRGWDSSHGHFNCSMYKCFLTNYKHQLFAEFSKRVGLMILQFYSAV